MDNDEYIFRIRLIIEIITLEQIIYNEIRAIDRNKLTNDNPVITLITIHQNLREKLIIKLKKE